MENDIYNAVATALRAAHTGIFTASEDTPAPPKLPAVSIVEADNRVFERMRTENIENAASVMYEVNIYSNKASGGKTEAKAIAATADAAFAAIGFTRTLSNPAPNFNDARIYRIVCRYEATVDKDLWIYHN